jgi:hypothetical protein
VEGSTIDADACSGVAWTGLVEDEPEEAIQAFRDIVTTEEEKGDWCVSFARL